MSVLLYSTPPDSPGGGEGADCPLPTPIMSTLASDGKTGPDCCVTARRLRVYLAVLAVEVTQRLETLRLNNAHLREHLLLLTQLTLRTRNSTQRHALPINQSIY